MYHFPPLSADGLDVASIAPRLRKRSRAQTRRALQSALTVPTDDKGETINVHTAAYNGVVDLLVSYITQGGDLEVSLFIVSCISRVVLSGGSLV